MRNSDLAMSPCNNAGVLSIEGPIASSAELRAHVVSRIESGEWAPGARLPSVRQLADRLGLAPNTVAKAYRDLADAGWVHTAGRQGTLVAERFDGNVEARALTLAIDYWQAMRGLGFDLGEATRFLNRAAE